MNVAAILRNALRRLETERARVDRQVGALKAALDGTTTPTKAHVSAGRWAKRLAEL